MVATWHDIAHVIAVVTRCMHKPDRSQWNAIKHMFSYLVGTQDLGILFDPNKNLVIVAYTNSDFASCVYTRNSTTG